MKLEYLPDGSDDCPLVRMYDFVPTEVAGVLASVSKLIYGTSQQIALHKLPGVEAVGECRLFISSGLKDQGLLQLAAPAAFECILSKDGWEDVAGLIEPFSEGIVGYQWLSVIGDAKWLFSLNGTW